MAEELTTQAAIAKVVALLEYYSFDLGGVTAPSLIQDWQEQYSLEWIRIAVLESLYRGRYKSISVEEILRRWQKRGEPLFNFDRDFERLICAEVDKKIVIAQPTLPTPEPTALPTTASDTTPEENVHSLPEIESFQPEILGRDIHQKLKAIAIENQENPILNDNDSPANPEQ